MVLQARSKIYTYKNGRTMIYVPVSIREDSQYPFNDASTLINISISSKKIVIEGVQ